MALPMIEVPKYYVNLPSTGEKIVFRPFLVKEQKQLLVAVNGDLEQQMQAVDDIINACTFGKVNANTLSAYDAEYLFLQIRARSIGETIDLVLSCAHCENQQPGSLDLTSVQVQKPLGHEYTIELDGDIIIKLSDPNIRNVNAVKENNTPDTIIELIARSIQSIWKGDEIFSASDYTVAELIDFVENLSPISFEKIEQFFNTLPVLRHDVDFECKQCGAKNTATLEGLESFFV